MVRLSRSRCALICISALLSSCLFQIVSAQNDAATVAELRQADAVGVTAGESNDDRRSRIAGWIGDRDLSSISLTDLEWLVERLTSSDQKDYDLKIEWSGQLTPDRSGDFVFSPGASRFNLKTIVAEQKHDVQIWVDGDIVSESRQVRLSQGEPVSLRVVMEHKRNGPVGIRGVPIVVSLLWKSSEMLEPQVVPTSLFATVDGKPGLSASILMRTGVDEFTLSRVDPSLDLSWASIEQLNENIAQPLDRLGGEVMARINRGGIPTERATSAAIAAIRSRGHEDRVGVAKQLLERPILIESLTPRELKNYTQLLSGGNQDRESELLLAWLRQNADLTAEISDSFLEVNRHPIRAIADELVLGNDTIRREIESLVEQNGDLNLAAAYILSFVSLREGKIDQWIRFLDERLADDQQNANQRINWLLARAQAQEIRSDLSARHVPGTLERPFAGRQWIEEATLIATAQPDARRTAIEYLARLIMRQPKEVADEYLDKHFNGVEVAELQESVAAIYATRDAEQRRIQELLSSFSVPTE
ncbi:MAG: hypothetical protein KDA87_23440 [Planctomycetales bacterium]|nr:hypothetical protein [Planctomycetales bacterium]